MIIERTVCKYLIEAFQVLGIIKVYKELDACLEETENESTPVSFRRISPPLLYLTLYKMFQITKK